MRIKPGCSASSVLGQADTVPERPRDLDYYNRRDGAGPEHEAEVEEGTQGLSVELPYA